MSRSKLLFPALISILAVPPSPAVAAPLEPTSGWNVDYGETQCVASREYGTAQHPLTLAIKPVASGGNYEISVLRKRSPPPYALERKGSVDFGKGPISTWLLHYGKTADILQYRLSAADMTQARTATQVSLHAVDDPDFVFSLRSMPALLEGLDRCVADLKSYWGIGKPTDPPRGQPPKGGIVKIFSSADYPGEAIDRGQEGSAQYLLLIDEKGSVAGCDVFVPSGVPALDAEGCVVIRRRAKFVPATDATGKPVRSAYFSPPVRWVIEGD